MTLALTVIILLLVLACMTSIRRMVKILSLMGLITCVIICYIVNVGYLSKRYAAFSNESRMVSHQELTAAIGNEPKVRFEPKVSEREAMKAYIPEIIDRVPTTFLPEFRNPCWFEKDQLKCLPYFYQVGSYKCGTSDLWDKLVQHPQIFDVLKEPHWWAWRRFGYIDTPIHSTMVNIIRNITGDKDDSSFDWYLNWFQHQLNGSMNNSLVIGDASITQLWGTSDGKRHYHGDEPTYVLADVIHAVQPKSKIFAILRNPIDRALSAFFYAHKEKSMKLNEFHKEVKLSLNETEKCIALNKSARACAFSLEIGNWRKLVPLHGAYYLYLNEWLEAYGRDHVHVIKMEDWMETPETVLPKLIHFLELEPLTPGQISSILSRKVQNSRKQIRTRKSQFDVMLNKTRILLEDFYRPWNQKLVELLIDSRFTWDF